MVKTLLESGWKINEILDAPMYYLMEIIRKEEKPKKERSLIAAFGG